MTDVSETFATPRVAAGVLFRDEVGRVLLVKPSYKSGWDLPGGYVERGESPRNAASREVREELGVDLPVGGLLIVDWAPHPDEGDKLLFVFDGGVITDAQLRTLHADATEIEEIALHSESEFDALLPDRIARRLLAGMNLRGPYLEKGKAP